MPKANNVNVSEFKGIKLELANIIKQNQMKKGKFWIHQKMKQMSENQTLQLTPLQNARNNGN